MSLPYQKFREIVFQLLFCEDFVQGEEEVSALLIEQLFVTKKSLKEAQVKKEKILEHLQEIDAVILQFSLSYDPERIGAVERAILRLGIYELCHEPSIPPKVVIAEAIRLARKFATAESSSFVNGLLDAFFQKREKDATKLSTE